MMITDIFSQIFFVTASFYLFIGLLIHFGLTRRFGRCEEKPKITILVAVRNEENNLPACLDSLVKQTYPSDYLQILVLNDRSTDDSRKIISEYAKRYRQIKLIDISVDKNGLQGKMNVLSQGMDYAEGEIILITDADCRVPEIWVTEMVTYFTPRVGLVGGLTVVKRSEKGSDLFSCIQTLDCLFLQAIAAGTAGIKLPVSVLGNNFGFKKTVYDQIGGFRKIGFSLTEDMVLLNAIKKNTTFKIVYSLNQGTMIQSLPLKKLREFLQQRRRWLSGGLKASYWGWILMITSFLIHLLIIINMFMLNFNFTVLAGLIFLTGIDFSLLWRLILKSGVSKFGQYFPAFEVFYIFYTIFLAIGIVIPGRITWKDRRYKTSGKVKQL